jgi:hypothetical protein
MYYKESLQLSTAYNLLGSIFAVSFIVELCS